MQLSCTQCLPYPWLVLCQGILPDLLSQKPGNLNFKYFWSSEAPLTDSNFKKVLILLRINKAKKSERVKLSDRGHDYTVNSNPEVLPVPCKHPWNFMCRDNLGQLAVHSLPQSQFSRGVLQGYSTAQESGYSLQGLECFPESHAFCQYSLVSGTTGISS